MYAGGGNIRDLRDSTNTVDSVNLSEFDLVMVDDDLQLNDTQRLRLSQSQQHENKPDRLSVRTTASDDRERWLAKRGKEILEAEVERREMAAFRERGVRRWLYWNLANITATAVCLIIGGVLAGIKREHSYVFLALGFGQLCFCINELCFNYTDKDFKAEPYTIAAHKQTQRELTVEEWWPRHSIACLIGAGAFIAGLTLMISPGARATIHVTLSIYSALFGLTHLAYAADALNTALEARKYRKSHFHKKQRSARREMLLYTMAIKRNWWGIFWATFFVVEGINYLVTDDSTVFLGLGLSVSSCAYCSAAFNECIASLVRNRQDFQKAVRLEVLYKEDGGRLMRMTCSSHSSIPLQFSVV